MRVAVFVDAGYLYAQGYSLITGKEVKNSRKKTRINAEEIVARLSRFATAVSKKDLLRIYWYDAKPTTGISDEQNKFAQHDNVKLRLGQLNSAGQQKGVDSLLVIDLTELARNKAITDAVVFTGDEDIRIAVEIAQNHGVRVHLLGIDETSARGSQSPTLQNEADTVKVWDRSEVESFITILDDHAPGAAKAKIEKAQTSPILKSKPSEAADVSAKIKSLLEAALMQIKLGGKLERLIEIKRNKKPIPGDVVNSLYVDLEKSIGKKPTQKEKNELKKLFKLTFEEQS